jgi:AcrR family transcriptional regulator
MRPLRSDAERNRRRILEAARAAFAEDGLHLTLDEIARRAGVGVGTVYRRFPNKELLIDALFEDRIGELAVIAEEALGRDDAWTGLVEFLERAIGMQVADRGLRELMLGTQHGKDRVAASRERLKPIVDALIARAQAQGDLRPDFDGSDLPLVLFMIDAVVDNACSTAPEVWRRCLALVLDGLRTSRDAPSPLPVPPLDDEQVDATMRAWKP